MSVRAPLACAALLFLCACDLETVRTVQPICSGHSGVSMGGLESGIHFLLPKASGDGDEPLAVFTEPTPGEPESLRSIDVSFRGADNPKHKEKDLPQPLTIRLCRIDGRLFADVTERGGEEAGTHKAMGAVLTDGALTVVPLKTSPKALREAKIGFSPLKWAPKEEDRNTDRLSVDNTVVSSSALAALLIEGKGGFTAK